MTLQQIEQRFKQITKLDIDLSKFPIKREDYKEQKQKTIKELSDKYGFVPTPIFLVDTMIAMKHKRFTKESVTCDYCAGCGQYSVRLLRYITNIHKMDINQFLQNQHYFTQLQLENCAMLVYIFGPNINLYVGDSKNLKYSDQDDKGILFFNEDEQRWEHNDLIDKLIQKDIIKNNKDYLSFIFNNYKDKGKIIEFLNNIKK